MSQGRTITVLLLLLVATGLGESFLAETLVKSVDKVESGGCYSAGYDEYYCCYDKKCSGAGQYVNKTIKCDQKFHYCSTNYTTGYPLCVPNEDGGDWTLCLIISQNRWYTCGCDYDSRGRATECDCWHGLQFYIAITAPVLLAVVGFVLRVGIRVWTRRRYARLS